MIKGNNKGADIKRGAQSTQSGYGRDPNFKKGFRTKREFDLDIPDPKEKDN